MQVISYTRVSAGTSGIPDIVILCSNDDNGQVIIVENKILASEGSDQTDRYSTDVTVDSVVKNLSSAFPARRSAAFVYLTLPHSQSPKSNRFVHKTYRDLLRAASNISDFGDATANQQIPDMLDTYPKFCIPNEFKKNEYT
jgi:hypothetical protein